MLCGSCDRNTVLLNEIVKHFFKGNVNLCLENEHIHKMDWSWQQQFLDATINNPLLKKYPVSGKFTKLFLKKIIDSLEPIQEVHDDIYVQLCNVMHDCNNNGFCYRHYMIGNNLENIVTIKETRSMVVNGTTGLRTWEAAMLLADWALCNQELFTNKNVLELGSGVGFTGIAISKSCKLKSLIFTDCHNEVLKTIEENIKINFPSWSHEEIEDMKLYKSEGKSLGVMMLDWNETESLSDEIVPDILIGADIVYDPSILIPLCNVINTFCKRNNSLEVYIASIIRKDETYKEFLTTLDNFNLQYEELKLEKTVFIEWDETANKSFLKIKLKI